MEAFSLLKYWRAGSGGAAAPAAADVRRTTVASSVLRASAETGDDDGDDDGEADDEGPFFDLEFSVPDEHGEAEEESGEENDSSSSAESDEEPEEREFNYKVSSEGSCGRGVLIRSDPSVSLSPSDDLLFKGSSLVLTTSEPNSKPQFPASLLKSATKFRVFLFRLRLKKPKSTPPESAAAASPMPQHSKFFIKFKVEEVPIVSLFSRDNSSRSSSGIGRSMEDVVPSPPGSDEKFAKDAVRRYISKFKPFYVRASKRHGEEVRISGQLNRGSSRERAGLTSACDADGAEKPPAGNLQAGLRVVCRRLRKSRSASSAVAAVRSPPPPRRRDDSLLQHEDGIQSAIAHCKRSFNADKGSELPLVRSRSDPGGESRV